MQVSPVFTQDDFLAGMQRLLPTGPVWPRDPDAAQTQVWRALMILYALNAQAAAALLIDAFPASTVQLLPEWEETLGLPDPCAGVAPSLQLRQQQVLARFIAGGGQTPAYFIAVAAALGYTITITQFAPFRAGVSRAGDADNDELWAWVWQVNAPQFTINFFRAGENAAGDPLESALNTVLTCELQRLAPAHTTLIFNFAAPPPPVFRIGAGGSLIGGTDVLA